MGNPSEKDIDLQADDSAHLLLLTMDNFKKKEIRNVYRFSSSPQFPTSLNLSAPQ